MTTKEKRVGKKSHQQAVCWKPSTEFLTGDWKTYMPIRDPEKCTRCLLCVIFCPDGAIHWKPEKEDIEFDYNFCKGCGICANECPTKAIEMKLG
jgi:2-oxoacid:acceptor oxidoreductase delta subunit (pyruvate/2-ketoisovalerate family)